MSKSQSRISPGNIKLYGVFGYPLKHTLSPPMQQAGFNQLNLPSFYLAFEFSLLDFKKIMSQKKRLLLEGFNLTVPYKQTVMKYVDRLSPQARLVGAVNTVIKKGKLWIGDNTDSYGFMKLLQEELGWRSKGKKVLVLGAGGASRACVYGLCADGAREIILLNRTVRKAEKIQRDFKKRFPKTLITSGRLDSKKIQTVLSEVDLAVNTTSLGLKKNDPDVVKSRNFPRAKRAQAACDLIYNPSRTSFLKNAKSKGWKTVGGLGMLFHQGVKSFELWTGKKAPVKEMKKALEKALSS